MAATPTPAPNVKRRGPHRLRDFWARVTEGIELGTLGRQFVSDAKASYSLYSKDVDWDEVGRSSRGPGRIWLSAWALFQAMLMKLTPARRVLLLLAIVLLLIQPDVRWGARREFSLNLGGLGVALLFLLLAVELADRVTMKRDLEIAREIQQWLVPDHPPSVAGVDIAFATRPQNTAPAIITMRSSGQCRRKIRSRHRCSWPSRTWPAKAFLPLCSWPRFKRA